MKQLLHTILFIIILLSRLHTFAQNPKVIDIIAGMNCPGNLKLADITDEIMYVPLETTNENLINNIDKVKFSDEYIFIKNLNPAKLYLFNRSGKYIRQIGHKGNGPNEYNTLSGFCFNEADKTIYIYASSPAKILIYDIGGRFLEKIDCPDYHTQPFFDMEFIQPDRLLMMLCNVNGNTQFSYKIFTTEFKLIQSDIRPVQFSSRNYFSTINEFSCYHFNNSLFVKENILNDTLYQISADNSFIPKLVFNSGKYECPARFRQEFMEFVKRKDFKYILMNHIIETKEYWLYNYSFNKDEHFDYYDKSLNKSFSFISTGIPNNYDNGPSFVPLRQKNNELIGVIYSMDLIQHMYSDDFRNSIPKYPEKKKNFHEFVSSLNENDNPVLILVKLKE
ncbi:6-bladed beta-propeller [Draconibacterium mangrovi]|uniref:6-bladed beta-propeller n=1 Tax=Draconibacterium mangrovi TaxID=2697469 RepID=UPI0013D86550|nr:6-bladed beta-propeller [Draconibacterium mangrovi]